MARPPAQIAPQTNVFGVAVPEIIKTSAIGIPTAITSGGGSPLIIDGGTPFSAGTDRIDGGAP
jgi:hypothetical protein